MRNSGGNHTSRENTSEIIAQEALNEQQNTLASKKSEFASSQVNVKNTEALPLSHPKTASL